MSAILRTTQQFDTEAVLVAAVWRKAEQLYAAVPVAPKAIKLPWEYLGSRRRFTYFDEARALMGIE